jgi:tripartite-type tricarboxylate transporter receptor subunit TctC
LPVNSIQELVALAKRKPGELNWAGVTPGVDFTLAAWLKHEDIDIKEVPYRNPVEAANDLAENRVQLYDSAIAILQAHQQAGKVRLLAVTNSARWPTAPEVPTVTEAGAPLLTLDGLVGLFGPINMTVAERNKVARDVKTAFDGDPTIRQRIAATSQIANPGGPAEFEEDIAHQRETIARAANALGVAAKW